MYQSFESILMNLGMMINSCVWTITVVDKHRWWIHVYGLFLLLIKTLPVFYLIPSYHK